MSYKKGGKIIQLNEERMMPEQCESLIREIYELADHRDIGKFLQTGDDDFSFTVKGLSRYRVSTYMQRGSLAAVIRMITFSLPDPSVLGIPEQIIDLGNLKKDWYWLQALPEAANLRPWPASSMPLMKTRRNTSSLWKIPWNSFTSTKKAL